MASKTKKNKKVSVELIIKKIQNGYTVDYFVDDDYNNYACVYCSTRDEVLDHIGRLEF